jgi:tetratricopeptide (TPR) repeat protein
LPAAAEEEFNGAIAKCDAATKSRPDFFQAQALAAHCYNRLAQQTANTVGHADLIKTAQERFALAAVCTGADSGLYQEWGTMLETEADPDKRPTEREALLREARRVFEAGLTLSGLNAGRATLECALGNCLILLAKNSDDADDRQTLCSEALRLFNSAAKDKASASLPELHAFWGAALVESAKETGSRTALREAIEQLELALQKGSPSLDVHYNLSCAYAVLGQTDQALTHLRVCLNSEGGRKVYRQAAASDPQLRSLDQVPSYNALFEDKQAVSAGSVVKPALSDR